MTHATVHVMMAEHFADAPLTHRRCPSTQPARETDIAGRMLAALGDDGTALVGSHQLPIFIARRAVERKPFVHDPRGRETALCSLTTDLIPKGSGRKFGVGT